MIDKVRPQNKHAITVRGITRRQFAKRAAALAGGASLSGALPAFRTTANAAETLKVGFISPRSSCNLTFSIAIAA